MESNHVGLWCSRARSTCSVNNCLMNDRRMLLKLGRETWLRVYVRGSLVNSAGSQGAGWGCPRGVCIVGTRKTESCRRQHARGRPRTWVRPTQEAVKKPCQGVMKKTTRCFLQWKKEEPSRGAEGKEGTAGGLGGGEVEEGGVQNSFGALEMKGSREVVGRAG